MILRIVQITFSIFFIFVGSLIFRQMFRIFLATQKVSYTQTPFTQNGSNSKLNVYFLGDSTAVGTGAATPQESVAGRFGKDFPEANIQNFSQNGKRLAQLISDFPMINQRQDLIVLQIGANDILKLTPYKAIDERLTQAINKAKAVSDCVLILHSGNVGLAPIFSWPFNDLYTKRSRVVRALYIEKAKQMGVHYVDLFEERENDIFLTDIPRYYARDLLHPSGFGYEEWYRRLKKTLDASNCAIAEVGRK